MRICFAKRQLLLHVSIFVLMLLGAVVRPTLINLSQAHLADHWLAADASGHDDTAGDHTATSSLPFDKSHLAGAHGQLHAAESSMAADFFLEFSQAASLPAGLAPQVQHDLQVHSGFPPSPFRPPIV